MGIELFERAAEARARILRVDRLDGVGSDSVICGLGYLLTFDVGRILVVADTDSGSLTLRQIDEPSTLSGSLVVQDEAEPWWRVAGNPITRVWPGAPGEGAAASTGALRDVRIQFREDEENPKVVSLRFEAGTVQVAMENGNAG